MSTENTETTDAQRIDLMRPPPIGARVRATDTGETGTVIDLMHWSDDDQAHMVPVSWDAHSDEDGAGEEDVPRARCAMSDYDALSRLAAAMHQIASEHGFHDFPETEEQFINRACARIHGEVSELHEAMRDGTLQNWSDKPGLGITRAAEELADVIIQSLDTAEELRVDIGRAVLAKAAYNRAREYRHGGKKA